MSFCAKSAAIQNKGIRQDVEIDLIITFFRELESSKRLESKIIRLESKNVIKKGDDFKSFPTPCVRTPNCQSDFIFTVCVSKWLVFGKLSVISDVGSISEGFSYGAAKNRKICSDSVLISRIMFRCIYGCQKWIPDKILHRNDDPIFFSTFIFSFKKYCF